LLAIVNVLDATALQPEVADREGKVGNQDQMQLDKLCMFTLSSYLVFFLLLYTQ
jgi:hypothetical protein